MADFARLLAYFRRPDVEALYFEADQPIALRLKGEMSNLTPRPLSNGEIQAILNSGPLAPILSQLGQGEQRTQLLGPDGSALQVTASFQGGIMRFCLRRPGVPECAQATTADNAPNPSGGTQPARTRTQTPGAALSSTAMTRRSGKRPTKRPQSKTGVTRMPNAGSSGVFSMHPRPHARTPIARAGDSGSRNRNGTRKSNTISPAAGLRTPKTKAARTRPKTPSSPLASPESLSLEEQEAGSVHPKLQEILTHARSQGASDVHLVSERPILLRTIGELLPGELRLSHEQAQGLLLPLLGTRDKEQFETKGYADFAIECAPSGRYRVNLCRHKHGIKGCFRVLPPTPPSMEALGLPPELVAVLDHHQGLAVIAGPNGQGKSTTLAALVNRLNQKKAIHIISVEDPIEIVHPIAKAVVSQRQVGRDTKNYYSALKAALREDPDVIVIGELRDRETVEMALSAAETGHLVIASMNTPSGSKTIGRLIDLFPPDDQAQVRATLAGALKVVTAQRLVPCADGRRRVAAIELLTGGVPLWSLIRENKLYQLPGLMQRGRKFGMIRLKDSLDNLLEQGLIDTQTHRRYVANEEGPAKAAGNSDPQDLESSSASVHELSAHEQNPPHPDSEGNSGAAGVATGAVGKMRNFFKKATG